MCKPDYYQIFLQSKAYLESRQDKARLISRILGGKITPQTENIVDLGSGSGIVKEWLEKEWGRPIIGIEYDQPFIKYKTNTCAGDVSRMPFKTSRIDLAICNHLFEHVEKKREFIAEIRRVLKPQGIIYFTICNKYKLIEPHYRLPFLSWLPKGIADFYLRITSRGRQYRGIEFFSYRELTDMFIKEGLRVENVTWEVITQNADKMDFLQRTAMGVLARAGQNIRSIIINTLSPQWFLIITK